VPSEPAGVAAHHVSEDSGVFGSRVSPAWAPSRPGRFLATPAHGVGHAQWAANGRRSHGSRAGPFGKGSVVARPAYRPGAKLPWKKEPDPTLPGPLSRRRQSSWFGSQSIRRPAEAVSQSGPYGGSVWPVGRVRRRPRHHPLGSPLLWCTAAGCGGPSGAPRSLSVRSDHEYGGQPAAARRVSEAEAGRPPAGKVRPTRTNRTRAVRVCQPLAAFARTASRPIGPPGRDRAGGSVGQMPAGAWPGTVASAESMGRAGHRQSVTARRCHGTGPCGTFVDVKVTGRSRAGLQSDDDVGRPGPEA